MKTPNADALVKEGIQLDKSYVFMYCAPTRSAIMSGRLPYHVNQVLTGANMKSVARLTGTFIDRQLGRGQG